MLVVVSVLAAGCTADESEDLSAPPETQLVDFPVASHCIGGVALSFRLPLPAELELVGELDTGDLESASSALRLLSTDPPSGLAGIFAVVGPESEAIVIFTETPGADVVPSGEYSPEIGLGRLVETSDAGSSLFRQPPLEGRHYSIAMRVIQPQRVSISVSIDGTEELVDKYGPQLLRSLDELEPVAEC